MSKKLFQEVFLSSTLRKLIFCVWV